MLMPLRDRLAHHSSRTSYTTVRPFRHDDGGSAELNGDGSKREEYIVVVWCYMRRRRLCGLSSRVFVPSPQPCALTLTPRPAQVLTTPTGGNAADMWRCVWEHPPMHNTLLEAGRKRVAKFSHVGVTQAGADSIQQTGGAADGCISCGLADVFDWGRMREVHVEAAW